MGALAAELGELYEMRWRGYYALKVGAPAVHIIPGLARWLAYQVLGDCQIDDWEDRANGDGGWRPGSL